MSVNGNRANNNRWKESVKVSRSLALARPPYLLLGLLVALLALALVSQYGPANAQETGVSISALDCAGDPEFVTIVNGGSDAVDLTEWVVVSDPLASESFALTDVGELAGGASVNIQSGPAAGGALVWSTDEIFRDDDASDFARLLDATGATVNEVACAVPTPTPSPTTEPTMSADGIPNGGGPPAGDSGPLTPLLLAGAGLFAGALALTSFTLAPQAALRGFLLGSRRRREAIAERSAFAESPLSSGSRSSLLVIGLITALLMLVATITVGVRTRR